MKRAMPIVLALAAAALGYWFWTTMFPSPEHAIRSRLNALAKTISFDSAGGAIGNAYNAQKAADFFTSDVSVEVAVPGYDAMNLHGRDEVLQAAMMARMHINSLKVEFPDMNITVDSDGQGAKVNLTGTAIIPGEKDISAQEFNVMLKKIDGKWVIYKVETVKTLS